MMQKNKLRQADVLTSIFLVALGVAVLFGAWQMPRSGTYAGQTIQWYTSPAFFPFLIGVCLILCSVGVFVRAVREGGHLNIVRQVIQVLKHLPHHRIARRIITIWLIVLAYVICLAQHPLGRLSEWLGRLGCDRSSLTLFLVEPEGANYVVSSCLFLSVFVATFYRPQPGGWSWRTLAALVAGSILVSWGVGYLFTEQLYCPLPW